MTIQIKRVYEAPDSTDGKRILVDRLWPRGLTKLAARVDYWAKSIAPSHELRQWYQHDPSKWPEFQRRYFAELERDPDGVRDLRAEIGKGVTTLLYSSKETAINNAVALQQYLKSSR